MQLIRGNTVRRYLRDPTAAEPKTRPEREQKLDPYRHYVEQRLRSAAPHWLPAVGVCRYQVHHLGAYSAGITHFDVNAVEVENRIEGIKWPDLPVLHIVVYSIRNSRNQARRYLVPYISSR